MRRSRSGSDALRAQADATDVVALGRAPTVEAVTVAGEEGLLIEEPGRPNSWAVTWQPSPTTIAHVRHSGLRGEQVRDARRGIRVVGEEEWLATLPAATVRPAAVPAEVRALAQGVPRPSGRGWDELRIPAVARDGQGLADQVIAWAVCAWNDESNAATAARDGAPVDAAIAAVAASGTWPAAAIAYPSSVAASRAGARADQMRAETGIISMCR